MRTLRRKKGVTIIVFEHGSNEIYIMHTRDAQIEMPKDVSVITPIRFVAEGQECIVQTVDRRLNVWKRIKKALRI